MRAVVLTGTGKAFCVGQDLAEHAEALRADPDTTFATVHEHYNPIVTLLATMPKPVIAAINGTCVGAGLGFALARDLRVIARTARFGTAFTKIGLTCDSGLSASLGRTVGSARASELILLGEPFTAPAPAPPQQPPTHHATTIPPDSSARPRRRRVPGMPSRTRPHPGHLPSRFRGFAGGFLSRAVDQVRESSGLDSSTPSRCPRWQVWTLRALDLLARWAGGVRVASSRRGRQ